MTDWIDMNHPAILAIRERFLRRMERDIMTPGPRGPCSAPEPGWVDLGPVLITDMRFDLGV